MIQNLVQIKNLPLQYNMLHFAGVDMKAFMIKGMTNLLVNLAYLTRPA
ncbi:MAG: hypothetical protein V4714_02675 [Bacteroidota bacterium]